MTAPIPADDLEPTAAELEERRRWAAESATYSELTSRAHGVISVAIVEACRSLALGNGASAAYWLRQIGAVTAVVTEWSPARMAAA